MECVPASPQHTSTSMCMRSLVWQLVGVVFWLQVGNEDEGQAQVSLSTRSSES